MSSPGDRTTNARAGVVFRVCGPVAFAGPFKHSTERRLVENQRNEADWHPRAYVSPFQMQFKIKGTCPGQPGWSKDVAKYNRLLLFRRIQGDRRVADVPRPSTGGRGTERLCMDRFGIFLTNFPTPVEKQKRANRVT